MALSQHMRVSFNLPDAHVLDSNVRGSGICVQQSGVKNVQQAETLSEHVSIQISHDTQHNYIFW